MYQNYMNKPAFMSNTPNSGFGASTSSFGQPAANTSMFSSMQPSNIFQTPSTSSFNPGPSTQTSFARKPRKHSHSRSPDTSSSDSQDEPPVPVTGGGGGDSGGGDSPSYRVPTKMRRLRQDDSSDGNIDLNLQTKRSGSKFQSNVAPAETCDPCKDPQPSTSEKPFDPYKDPQPSTSETEPFDPYKDPQPSTSKEIETLENSLKKGGHVSRRDTKGARGSSRRSSSPVKSPRIVDKYGVKMAVLDETSETGPSPLPVEMRDIVPEPSIPLTKRSLAYRQERTKGELEGNIVLFIGPDNPESLGLKAILGPEMASGNFKCCDSHSLKPSPKIVELPSTDTPKSFQSSDCGDSTKSSDTRLSSPDSPKKGGHVSRTYYRSRRTPNTKSCRKPFPDDDYGASTPDSSEASSAPASPRTKMPLQHSDLEASTTDSYEASSAPDSPKSEMPSQNSGASTTDSYEASSAPDSPKIESTEKNVPQEVPLSSTKTKDLPDNETKGECKDSENSSSECSHTDLPADTHSSKASEDTASEISDLESDEMEGVEIAKDASEMFNMDIVTQISALCIDDDDMMELDEPIGPPINVCYFQSANRLHGIASLRPGTNLFGQQPQPSTSGLFGGSNAFGQNKTTFGFGSTQAQTGLFGQQPQQQTGSSLFQSSTPNLFGSSAFGSQTTGTVIKFSPVTGTDTMQKNGVTQSISTKHHCITCMKEYENKSLEELRFEDYSCSRKGPQQQSGFGSAPFGTTTTGSNTSLFGQTDNKQGFGQPQGFGQTPAFGQTTPAFGVGNQANTSSLFGKPNNTFGATTSTTPAFGFNATPSTSNPFSANQAQKPFSQPLFGTTTTQAQPSFGTGVFGQTSTQQNTTTNLFQKPAQPTTGFNTGQQGFSFNQPSTTLQHNLFQVSKPNTGFGIFGQTTTTPGFSQTSQPTFGTNFGKMSQTTLTQTSQPAFGTSLSGGLQPPSLFGNTTAKPPSLFGNTPGGNLFNSNVFQQTPPTFSLNMNQQQPAQFPPEPADDTKNMPFIANDSFPDGPHFTLDPVLALGKSSTTNPQDIKAMLESTKTREEYTSTSPKIKVSGPKPKRGDNCSKEFFEANKHLRSSHKCLIIRKFGENQSAVIYNKYQSDLVKEAKECIEVNGLGDPDKDLPTKFREMQQMQRINECIQLGAYSDDTGTPQSNSDFDDLSLKFNPMASSTENQLISESSSEKSTPRTKGSSVTFVDEEAVDIVENEADDEPTTTPREEEDVSNPAGVVLTRPEYYIYPDLKDLHQYMNENNECIVQGLTIGRKGYGNIYFLDPVNITNMNFDELVHFRHREVIVYPDDTKKPPLGEGLNRRAQVTLDKIYPREKGTNSYITDVTKIIESDFVDKLMNVTLKHDSKFVDYRPKTGSWVFNVKHFSKYGFTDSDDESCVVTSTPVLEKKAQDVPKKPETCSSSEGDGDQTFGSTARRVSRFIGLESIVPESSSDLEDVPALGLGGRPLGEKKISRFVGLESGEVEPPSDDSLDEEQFVGEEMYHSRSTIQTMKASLFTNLESATEQKEPESVIRKYELPCDVVSTPRVHRLPDISLAIVPQKVTTTQRCYTELGVFKCNTYKVGWFNGLKFFKSDPCVEYDVIFALTKCSMNVGRQDSFSVMLPNIDDMLQVTLEESEFSFDNNKVPTLHIKRDLAYLQKQTELFNNHAHKESLTGQDKYLCSVWTLCSALWGPGDNDPCSRRQYVSDWLKNFSYDLSNEWNLNERIDLNESETFRALFELLSFYKITEACDFASKNNLNQLSLLISQLSANERVKFWNSKYIDNFIWKEKNIMIDEFKRVHLLLSGIPVHENINICDDLDWLRTFGLHLWYIAPAAAPVNCAFNLYKNAFEGEYATKPVPPYCDADSETTEYDLLYHILGLYVDCTYQLCKVLHPETHTENVMDYRLSWFMLHLFRSLNVGLIRDSEKEHLHTTFSTQLEHMGLWKWAVFALLFLENNHLKKNLIMRILERNLSTFAETSNVERELVKTFKIPPSWIHEVKATKAKLGGHYYDYFQHCLYMGDWRQANATFLDHILPELFLNQHYGHLEKFILKLEPYSNLLVSWNSEVGLFKEFMALESSLSDETETPPSYIAGKLSALFRRINCFPVKNDKQKLCVAQLSRKCALIFKLLEKCMDHQVFQTKFVDVISNLLMPSDMKHQELFYLVSKFVKEGGSVQ